jgi:hypothetical protein
LTSPSSPTTGLESLAVIDRLEVGPVKLEKNRLACPYTAFGPDGSDSTELIYKYEENVFDPNDKVDQNLAAVMAAQLALNYGLFCRRIVFHGSYDQADRRFLREMAVNTAREIYVKKLLEPNPFLLDEARNLPLIKQKSYLQAELEFSGPPLKDGVHAFGGDSNQYAVLSSGGKESLLSYSLLNELGHEVHPIFINESAATGLPLLTRTVIFQNMYLGPRACGPTPTGFSPGCSGTFLLSARILQRSGRMNIPSGCGPWPCWFSGPCL